MERLLSKIVDQVEVLQQKNIEHNDEMTGNVQTIF